MSDWNLEQNAWFCVCIGQKTWMPFQKTLRTTIYWNHNLWTECTSRTACSFRNLIDWRYLCSLSVHLAFFINGQQVSWTHRCENQWSSEKKNGFSVINGKNNREIMLKMKSVVSFCGLKKTKKSKNLIFLSLLYRVCFCYVTNKCYL